MDKNINLSDIKKEQARRISEARLRILSSHPFYGTLLLHLKSVFADCGTAATDMKRIIFDPQFVSRLSDKEIEFLILHEVMHCTLQHCLRGEGKNHELFNIACDIVVNSAIMEAMGVDSFMVDGEEPMHLTPKGDEGRKYSAEEVYDMFLAEAGNNVEGQDKQGEFSKDMSGSADSGNQASGQSGSQIDSHEIWEAIPEDSPLKETWREYVEDAEKVASCGGGAGGLIRNLLEEFDEEAKINWRQALHDYIKMVCEKYDYTFSPADKRFQDSPFILPAFTEEETEKIENLWFLVDTSGSITTEELSLIFNEVKAAVIQFEELSAKLSFFDGLVSEPVEFNSVESLGEITPVGGGGTSFEAIFKYMEDNMTDNLPTAVIILTDGYAKYPPERAALDVPVLWIIDNDDKGNEPPFGTTIRI